MAMRSFFLKDTVNISVELTILSNGDVGVYSEELRAFAENSLLLFNKNFNNVSLEEINHLKENTTCDFINALWSNKFAENDTDNEMENFLVKEGHKSSSDYQSQLLQAPSTLALTTKMESISKEAWADYQSILQKNGIQLDDEEKENWEKKLAKWQITLAQLLECKQMKRIILSSQSLAPASRRP